MHNIVLLFGWWKIFVSFYFFIKISCRINACRKIWNFGNIFPLLFDIWKIKYFLMEKFLLKNVMNIWKMILFSKEENIFQINYFSQIFIIFYDSQMTVKNFLEIIFWTDTFPEFNSGWGFLKEYIFREFFRSELCFGKQRCFS